MFSESQITPSKINLSPSRRAQKIKAIIKQIDKALASKNLQAAEDLIHKLRTIDSTPETSIRLAHLMFIEKKYLDAENLYKELLPQVSGNLRVEVLFGLGQTYFESMMYSDCHLVFSIISEFHPDYAYIHLIRLKLAKIMIRFKQFDNADMYLRKLLDDIKLSNSMKYEALVLMAHVKDKQGNKSESFEFAKKGFREIKIFKTVACVAFLLLDRNPHATENISRRILSKNRNIDENSDFFFFRALANMKLKNYEIAKVILEEQIKTNPLNYLYLEFLGIMYLKVKDNLRALEVFQRIRSLMPFDICNLKNLAYTYKICGYKEEAWHVLSSSNLVDENQISLADLEVCEPEMDILSFPTNPTLNS